MRKLWYAGATVASGLIMFAASPAQADEQPTSPQLLPGNSVAPPVGDLLSGTGGFAVDSIQGTGGSAINGAATATRQTDGGLDHVRRPTNNLHVRVPFDGSQPSSPVQPQSTEDPPAAGVTTPDPLTDATGYPAIAGLTPGGQPAFDPLAAVNHPATDDSLDRPVAPTESLPPLGGVLPDPGTPGGSDLSGLPAGGVAILAPASPADVTRHKVKPAETPSAAVPSSDPAVSPTVSPAASPTVSPAASPTVSPAAEPSSSSEAPDPRLHEEPIDTSERTFSPDNRPVAGVDQQYK